MNASMMYLILPLLTMAANCNANNNVLTERKTEVVIVPYSQGNQNNAPDGSCNSYLSTSPVAIVDTISGKGIVFAIRSDVDDEAGLEITSLGFHVNTEDLPRSTGNSNGNGNNNNNNNKGEFIEYEVYVLSDGAGSPDGYYADTSRSVEFNNILADTTSYDFRGQMDQWELIAAGNITSIDNLTQTITTMDNMDPDYFQIPYEGFTKTSIPGNGKVRSFYIATPQAASFRYTDPPSGKLVNSETALEGLSSGSVMEGEYTPKILTGEGVATYPLDLSAFMYQTKSFVGKVYWERECPTLAPSISAQPSTAPTLTASDSPSSPPTTTAVPTAAPSNVASDVPSLIPSSAPTVYVEQLTDGLLLTFSMPCIPGVPPSDADKKAMGGAVQALAKKEIDDKSWGKQMSKIKSEVGAYYCTPADEVRRRLMVKMANGDTSLIRRHLPVGSSALDFSMVITGEYRPPRRPGQDGAMETPSLGKISEDSINRDPEPFVKDLKDRAGAQSTLTEVEPTDIAAESFEFTPEEAEAIQAGNPIPENTPRRTKAPTQKPTRNAAILEADVSAAILEAEEANRIAEANAKANNNEDYLVIGIVITGGLIVLLGSYLLFRHGQRRAATKRREKFERRELEKQKKRWREEDSAKVRYAQTSDDYPKDQYGCPQTDEQLRQQKKHYPPPPPYGQTQSYAYPPQGAPMEQDYDRPPAKNGRRQQQRQ